MNVKKVARTVFMVILFTLIIISFAFWGLNRNMLTGVQSGVVLAAGSHNIDRDDYKRDFDRLRQQEEQRQRHPVSADELAAQGADVYVLNQLKTQLSLRVILGRLGVKPGMEMMAEELRKVPEFFDEVSGRFDRNKYRSFLNEQHLTDKKVKESVSDGIAMQHLSSALGVGMKPPTILAASEALMVHQNRDVSVLYVTPAMAGAIPAPTDAQLTAFMNENADSMRIRNPETRVLTIARFKLSDVAATVTPTEADIQKIIDFRKTDETVPETRTLVQIAAKDLATAQTVAGRLAKGEDAATVARAVGSSVVTYTDKPKTALPDPKTADAAFALAAGSTSQPIQGSLGYSVVRVVAITPAKLPDLAKLRTAAVDEAKRRAAQMKVTEQANKFEEALNSGTDMVAAAHAAGAHVYTTPPVALNGSTKDGKLPEGVTARVMQEVAALQTNEKSDIIEEAPNSGDYFVVRVDRIIPPFLPALADIKGELTRAWTNRQQVDRMQGKANEIIAKARSGTSLDDLAKQYGGSVSRITGLNRAEGQTLVPKYGQKLVAGAVAAKKGEVFTGDVPPAAGSTGPGTFFVARLDDIHQADPAASAPDGQRLLPQIEQALGDEMEQQLVRSVGQLVTVKSYPDRARNALGLAPLPKAGAETKEKAGGAAKK